MKITNVQLPTIQENTVLDAPVRQQHAANHQIAPVSNLAVSVHAARIEHALRSAPIDARPQQATPQNAQIDTHQKANKFKSACSAISTLCGAAVFPSIACLSFGVIGLVVPAALAVACVVFALLAGKPSEELQTRRAERQVQSANFDYRGTV